MIDAYRASIMFNVMPMRPTMAIRMTRRLKDCGDPERIRYVMRWRYRQRIYQNASRAVKTGLRRMWLNEEVSNV